jgi:hypothetical protein
VLCPLRCFFLRWVFHGYMGFHPRQSSWASCRTHSPCQLCRRNVAITPVSIETNCQIHGPWTQKKNTNRFMFYLWRYIYSFIDMNSNHYHFKQFHESYIVLYIPSGKHNKKLWKITIFNGKTHYKWPCSIILLYVCQRVCVYTSIYI